MLNANTSCGQRFCSTWLEAVDVLHFVLENTYYGRCTYYHRTTAYRRKITYNYIKSLTMCFSRIVHIVGYKSSLEQHSSANLKCVDSCTLSPRNTYYGTCTYYRRNTLYTQKFFQTIVYIWFEPYTNFQANPTLGWLEKYNTLKNGTFGTVCPILILPERCIYISHSSFSFSLLFSSKVVQD